MIRDPSGSKMSPRQKASEVMLERMGSHSGLEAHQVGEMTEREVALVNKQMEKLHSKMHKMLMKARKEEKDSEQDDE